MRVNQRLKPALAMTLCWTANSASNAASIDHRCDGEGAVAEAAAIDALAHDMHAADHEVGVGDESDQVQKSEQKHHVRRYAIDRNQDTAGGTAGGLR